MADQNPLGFTGGASPLVEAIKESEEAARKGVLTVPTLALTLMAASAAETARVSNFCIEAQKAEKEMWRQRAIQAEGDLMDLRMLQSALQTPYYARRLLKLIGAPVSKRYFVPDERDDG